MKRILLLFFTLILSDLSIKAQLTKHKALNLQSSIIRQKQISPDRSITSTQFKPSKELDSSWDTLANTWNFQDSVRNTYNSSGNITSGVTYNVGLTYPGKKIIAYNGDGKISADTTLYWDGNTYVVNQLTNYNYDSYGNQTEQLSYSSWNGSAWGNGFRNVYTYDLNNNQTQDSAQYWDGAMWFDSYKFDYTWTGGQLIEEMDHYWSGSAWYESGKYDYIYTNGQMSGLTSYIWDGTNWKNDENYVNIVWYIWNGPLSENSLLTSYTQQVPNGNLWKDTIKVNFTYNSFGNQTDYLEQYMPNATYLTSYQQKNSYQYNGNNSMMEGVEQLWVNDSIGLRNSAKREFSDFFQYTGINEIIIENKVTVYPNPFSTQTTISFEKEIKNATIMIMDMMGKEIKTQNFSGPELIIEKAEMKAGIYFLQIYEGQKNVVNKKIVLLGQ